MEGYLRPDPDFPSLKPDVAVAVLAADAHIVLCEVIIAHPDSFHDPAREFDTEFRRLRAYSRHAEAMYEFWKAA